MYEDLFSENLVDEPADIERVIEGNERGRYSGNESDKGDNENKSDQEENNDKDGDNKDDDKKSKVRKRNGPRVVLNGERLVGPRGICAMESFFSDIKLHCSKGKEREDLEVVMKRLELWCHRLAPRFHFDDSLKKIEKLGSKKMVQTHLKIARYGRNDDVIGGGGLAEEVPDSPPPPPAPVDPFDQLLASSAHPLDTDITAEQREQMLRNRLLAEERRAARIKKAQEMKQKFLAQHSSQASQSAEVPSTAENTDEPNNQPVASVGNPSDQTTEVENQAGEPTPSEEKNCDQDNLIDPMPLKSKNQNTQVDVQDQPAFQNEGSKNQTPDNADRVGISKKDFPSVETMPDEDIVMEDNVQISLREQTGACAKADEKIEPSDIEMDTDNQSCRKHT